MQSLCPKAAQAAEIAAKVCSRRGHEIASLQGSMQITPQGPVAQQVHLCVRCGLGVQEIRDTVEQAVNAHIGNEVNKRIAAIHQAAADANKSPVGEPGEKIIELPANAASAQA